MNKISGPGQFRSDGSQTLTQSMMTVDAHLHGAWGEPQTEAVSISIHERLPLMNGQSGCEVEVQLTPQQASQLANKLFSMLGQRDLASSNSREGLATP